MKLLILVPAYNEQEILEKNILKLYSYCKKTLKKYKWKIVISDNASVDKTLEIAKKLSKKYSNISFYHMNERPRSKAIKKVWLAEDADIYMYMDADLSTDINHITDLAEAIEKGYDISIGSRTSEAKRFFIREIISKTLILTMQTVFSVKIKDFQCGFKAINKRTRNNILPKMTSLNVGFMDAEMLVVASSKGYRIKEIPVKWQDLRKSKAPVIGGILDALFSIIKIKYFILVGKYK